MDEQQKHSETSRSAAPASQSRPADTSSGTSSGTPGAVKRHRGRNIALIVAALVILGVVVWRWHPWGSPGGASGAAGARSASGGRAGRGGAGMANMPQPVHVASATQGEMPVVLTALGTVTPLATVTVLPQLSGVLQDVYFKEGQMVKKGDVLAQIDPRPYQISLQNAQGTLVRDEALLQTARLDLKRYQTLLAQDSIASQQVDTQASLVRQYEGTVKSDQANIDSFKLDLIYARITAPVSGRVGLRQVDPGNYVTSSLSTGIVVITQLQPISVIFTTSEDNLQQIIQHTQNGEQLSATAYDRANTTPLEVGSLKTMDNQIDTTTGTVRLRALFDNKDNSLFPNQFVNIQLVVEDLTNQVVMPNAAVHRGAPNGVTTTFVYLVNADNTVSVRPVTLGVVDGENVGVTAGVTPGAVVVTEGGDRLRDGVPVSVPGATPTPARTVDASGAPAAGAQHPHNGKGRRNRQNGAQPPRQAGKPPPQ